MTNQAPRSPSSSSGLDLFAFLNDQRVRITTLIVMGAILFVSFVYFTPRATPLNKSSQNALTGSPTPTFASTATPQTEATAEPSILPAKQIATFFAPNGTFASNITTDTPFTAEARQAKDWVRLSSPFFAQVVWAHAADVPMVNVLSLPDVAVRPTALSLGGSGANLGSNTPYVPAANSLNAPAAAPPQPTYDLSNATDVAEMANRVDQAMGGGVQPVASPVSGQPIPTAVIGPVDPVDRSDPSAVALMERALRNSGVNVDATRTVEAAVACASDYTGGSCK